MNLNKNRIGKYELGRTLGEGNFAKVKRAVNVETGQSYAVKILEKDKLLHYKIVDHFKREICSLKLIRHPNVVRLYEVLATKQKIYIVLEFVDGGDLFDHVSCKGKLEESRARRYFQQLIDAVGYCHSKGVYHRDLKPENILLEASGNVKISDFGLSAVPQQFREDGLLHTTCGSANYVAPEVIAGRGYDGATADVWSCGVILFLLLTDQLPFEDRNLAVLYYRIFKGEFRCPDWVSPGAGNLVKRILDPNPKTVSEIQLIADLILRDLREHKEYACSNYTMQRITIPEIVKDEWFKQGYSPTKLVDEEEDWDNAVPTDTENHRPTEEKAPILMNAFQLIAMSQSLDLSGFFEEEDVAERKMRFKFMYSAKDIIPRIEETVREMGFRVQNRNGKLTLLHIDPMSNGNRHLLVVTEVFEVASCLHIVEFRKSAGDKELYKELCTKLSRDLRLQMITCAGPPYT